MIKYLTTNWHRWVPFAALAVFGCLVLPICASLAQSSGDPDHAYDQYTGLQQKIKAGEAALKEKERQERSALSELNDVDKDILYLNRRIENIEHTLRVKTVQLKNLDGQLNVAADDMAKALSVFEARIVEWYKSGSQQDIQFLLRAEDLGDFINRLYYSQIILDDDKACIDQIRSQKAELFSTRDKLQKEYNIVKSLKADLSVSRSDYQDLYSRKKSKLDNISNDVKSLEAALDEMEQESEDIANFLRGIEGSPLYPVAGKFDGTFSRPIDAPLGSRFGMRKHPILRKYKMHTGQDFPAPTGTAIRSAGGGRVVFSGWKTGYGRVIIIDHGGGLATLYGHCSRLLVSEGEFVMEGQVIAKVGSTGLSTGPHLHFEVRRNGDPKDPLSYIH